MLERHIQLRHSAYDESQDTLMVRRCMYFFYEARQETLYSGNVDDESLVDLIIVMTWSWSKIWNVHKYVKMYLVQITHAYIQNKNLNNIFNILLLTDNWLLRQLNIKVSA